MPTEKEKSLSNFYRFNGSLKKYSGMTNEYLKIITFWCISLLLMDSMYLAFAFFKFDDTTIDSMSGSCIAIGVLLHYFLLSSFCFSLCITTIQYLLFYKIPKIRKFLLLKSILFSFGLPIIPVAIVLSINKDAYINENQ